MKEFRVPVMTIVPLAYEDIICSSPCSALCGGFVCNECAECPEVFSCDVYDNCKSYNSMTSNSMVVGG